MNCSVSINKGSIDHAVLLEIADLALTHENKGAAGLQGDSLLTRWYEKERALAALLPAEADFALAHGNA